MGAAETQMVRDTRDPFLMGDLAQDMRTLGYMNTMGRRWPLIAAPTVILFRRQLETGADNEPGAWYPCAITHDPGSSDTIINRVAYAHGQNTAWQYTAVKTDGNGYISQVVDPVRVDFGISWPNSGSIVSPALPAWPVDLWVEPTVGGEFIVHWRYDASGQGDWPNDFAVYAGTAAGVIDYGSLLGTVDFVHGQDDYEYTTDEDYADGTKKTFGVRARNETPVAELNMIASEPATARADGAADGVIRHGTGQLERGLQ